MYLKKVDINELSYSDSLYSVLSVFHQVDFLILYQPSIRVVGIFNDNEELRGVFFYFVKSKWGIRYVIPPPFCPHNGLVFLSAAQTEHRKNSVIKELHQLIINYFKYNEKACYIRLVLPPYCVDTQVFQWNKWKVKVNYTYQINLNQTEDELFNQLSSEKRKSIRRCKKDEIIIQEEKNYETVKQLVLKTFQRQKKTININYLDKIFSQWADGKNSFAFVACSNQKPIAATFCVYDSKVCYYLLGGYDNEFAHHGAGVSCMWYSILKSKSMGVNIFDFEGSMLPAVERYFRDFGGHPVPYYACERIKLLI